MKYCVFCIFLYFLISGIHSAYSQEKLGFWQLEEEYSSELGLTMQSRYRENNGLDLDFRYRYSGDDGMGQYAYALQNDMFQIGSLEFQGLFKGLNSINLLSHGILYEETKTSLNRSDYTEFNTVSDTGISVQFEGTYTIGGFLRRKDSSLENSIFISSYFGDFDWDFIWMGTSIPWKESNDDWLNTEKTYEYSGGDLNLASYHIRLEKEVNTVGIINDVSFPETENIGWRFTPFWIYDSKSLNWDTRFQFHSSNFYVFSGEGSPYLYSFDTNYDYSFHKNIVWQGQLHWDSIIKWSQGLRYFNKYGGVKVSFSQEKKGEDIDSTLIWGLLKHNYQIKWGKQQYVSLNSQWQGLTWELWKISSYFYLTPQWGWKNEVSWRQENISTEYSFLLDTSWHYDWNRWQFSLSLRFSLPLDHTEYMLWPYHSRFKFNMIQVL